MYRVTDKRSEPEELNSRTKHNCTVAVQFGKSLKRIIVKIHTFHCCVKISVNIKYFDAKVSNIFVTTKHFGIFFKRNLSKCYIFILLGIKKLPFCAVVAQNGSCEHGWMATYFTSIFFLPIIYIPFSVGFFTL